MTTVYVGNLPADAQPDTLQSIFQRYGRVKSVQLIRERDRARARAYGLVEMPADEDAARASRLLNGQAFRGRFIQVWPLGEAEPGQTIQ
jgi:RNA recognition motif-containing protein